MLRKSRIGSVTKMQEVFLFNSKNIQVYYRRSIVPILNVGAAIPLYTKNTHGTFACIWKDNSHIYAQRLIFCSIRQCAGIKKPGALRHKKN